MQLLSVGASAMSWLWQILNSLWLMICQAIYPCINFAYMLFEKVASVNLFSDEIFQKLTGRIYVIMGIAMLFIFAYNLILMVINPEDKKSSGATGKLVKDIIISLTVVVLLPTIFNWLHIVQAHILEDNVIGTLILGGAGTNGNMCDSNDYECKCEFNNFAIDLTKYQQQFEIPLPLLNLIPIQWSDDRVNYLTNTCINYRNLNGSKRGARSIPSTVFSAFYTPTNFNFEECRNYLITGNSSVINPGSDDEQICVNYYYDVSVSKYTGNMLPFVYDGFLNAKISDGNDDSMQFHWFLAIIAGGFAAWAFLCYAMEIGVRVAKMGFLELISPIPVMMRVLPQNSGLGGMYNKWFKQYTNTFFDVFIRVFIINFSLFAISLVPDIISALWTSTISDDGGFFIKSLALVIIILGILKFAQDAPNLFKEFFGGMGSGNFKIRSPKAQFNDNKLAKKAVGYVGGAVTGYASSALTGKNPLIGALSGGKHTATSMGKADLTKPGGFTKAMKQGKKDSDEAQRNSKFTAFRDKLQTEGGFGKAIGAMAGEEKDNLTSWLTSTTTSDKKEASGEVKAHIASVEDIIMQQLKKDQDLQKSNLENQRNIYLGDQIYTIGADGKWHHNGEEYDKKAIKDEMDKYFAQQRAEKYKSHMVSESKDDQKFFKDWSEKFIDNVRYDIPKFGKEEEKNLLNALASHEKGITATNVDDLVKQLINLRKDAIAGDGEAIERLTNAITTIDAKSKEVNRKAIETEKKDVAAGKEEKK